MWYCSRASAAGIRRFLPRRTAPSKKYFAQPIKRLGSFVDLLFGKMKKSLELRLC